MPPETWLAADGTAVSIRPIRAADLALEVEFARRLSPRSLYQRLMSTRTPSLEELRRFADIDPERELALIATVRAGDRERQVGVVRYVREPSTERAEIAIVLADEWQGRGLGTRLLRGLIAAARKAKLQCLTGTALSTNDAVLALGRKLGFLLEADPRSATVTHLTLDLARAPLLDEVAGAARGDEDVSADEARTGQGARPVSDSCVVTPATPRSPLP
ncbi:MAG TPA: GNAT family N-acetyltransferase [Burkholderiales bacterium]|nr:GNAT family N-acetyltransferase [Burkholderiales bacterium]